MFFSKLRNVFDLFFMKMQNLFICFFPENAKCLNLAS